MILRHVDQRRAARDEHGGHRQHQPGVDAEPGPRAFLAAKAADFRDAPQRDILADQRAQAADNDQRHDDDLPDGIALHERRGEVVGQGGEAGIAKGGHGVEDRMEAAFSPIRNSLQSRIQDHSADRLAEESHDDDESECLADPGEPVFLKHPA